MATKLLPDLPISEAEYLSTSYHPDCDFVDGIVLERPLGQFDHANLQTLLAAIFVNNRRAWNVLGLVEQRLRVRPGKYRVPDLLVLPADYDRSQQVVTVAPLLCIEIFSPDDRGARILERCWEYFELGVPETWLFDPETKRAFVTKDRTLTEASGKLHCGQVEIDPAALFATL